LGPASAEAAVARNGLAGVLAASGKFEEAAELYRAAATALLAARGPADPATVRAQRNLGLILLDLGKLDEAETLLAATRQGRDGALELARLRIKQDRTAEARALLDEAENGLTRATPHTALLLATLRADADLRDGRLHSAADRLARALAPDEALANTAPVPFANALLALGHVQILRGQFVEAEETYRRAVGLYRSRLGDRHPGVARALHGLALVYQELGDLPQAEAAYQRSLDALTAAFGADHPHTAATLVERSRLYLKLDSVGAAEFDARKAIEIFAAAGPQHLHREGLAWSALGFALRQDERPEEAAAAFAQAISKLEAARGERAADLPPGLTELALIEIGAGRYTAAEQRLASALAIHEANAAASPFAMARTLDALARLELARGRNQAAVSYARRAAAIAEARLMANAGKLSPGGLSEQRATRDVYITGISALAAMPTDEAVDAEIWRLAQLARATSTGAALTQVAARFAAGEGPLAALVRQRSQAHEQWRALDAIQVELAVQGESDARPDRLMELRRQRDEAERRIRDLDAELRRAFPKFAEFASPAPLALDQTIPLLASDEALLSFVVGRSESYVLVLRRNGLTLGRAAIGRAALEDAVRKLRLSLDPAEILSGRGSTRFEVEEALRLYRMLLEPAEPALQGVRHVLAVPDGALEILPLGVLVTEPAAEDAAPAWLARRYAMTVLPSVGSLRALRAFQSSRPSSRFLGVGDPELQGAPSPGARVGRVLRSARGVADADSLRTLPRLPEAADELRAIANSLGQERSVVRTGRGATERAIRTMRLSDFGILAFATHAVVAGELDGDNEPGLVLTPPGEGTREEDGLLAASEIAQLELAADWVILSACNTAASDGRPAAEGLSGLARSFFLAGARSLLVSHWAVASDAAVLLTTEMIRLAAADRQLRKAEALQRSMMRLMDSAEFNHPLYWAPFVLAGDGGPLRQ
jgi:CHAT domain-containing protein/Tfp pilus assembly protein PilF